MSWVMPFSLFREQLPCKWGKDECQFSMLCEIKGFALPWRTTRIPGGVYHSFPMVWIFGSLGTAAPSSYTFACCVLSFFLIHLPVQTRCNFIH